MVENNEFERTDVHVVMVAKYPLPERPPTGGVERVVEISRLALSRKARVTLLVPNALATYHHRDDVGDIIYVRRAPLPEILSYWTVASRAVQCRLDQLKPDIVHVHDLAGFAFQWPALPRANRPGLVFTAHGVLDRDIVTSRPPDLMRAATLRARASLVKRIELRSRQLYDRVLVINDYVLQAMPDIRNLDWRAVPNPVDQAFIEAPIFLPVARSGFDLLQVGKVWPLKNTIGAIKIVEQLVEGGMDVRLNVVGPVTDAVYHQACIGLMNQAGLSDRVTFHGPATPLELTQWMDRSDALLLTSRQEVAPMVVAEAHCRGLPTAVPGAFGLLSMVDPETNGTFLDLEDSDVQAVQVRALLERRFDRSTIRKRALQRHNLDAFVSRTHAIYEDVGSFGTTLTPR